MATNVLLPQWGMNMEDGLLVRWLVGEGDTVEAGQPLVEVETAKINSELEAPVSGLVAHIVAPAGSTVKVGTIVAVIAAPGEVVPRPAGARPQSAPAAIAAPPQSQGPMGSPAQVTPAAPRAGGPGPAIEVVPRARLLAREQGIDLAQVEGSGPNGRILVADVERAVRSQAQAGDAASAGAHAGEAAPLGGLRKIIAQRMMLSVQSMAQVTLHTEADMTEAVRLREDLVSRWRPHRIRPLDLDMIVKATAAALAEHPRLNATFTSGGVRLLSEVNVGIAVAVPDGLIVPVIRGAAANDLLSIAREMRRMTETAREGGLSVDDVTGAGFTITSLAGYEVDAFTPIIDPPQVAILGVGRVVEKPWVHEGKVVVRSMMHLSLTFDHQALDGVPAGEFLRAVKRRLEDPGWMVA